MKYWLALIICFLVVSTAWAQDEAILQKAKNTQKKGLKNIIETGIGLGQNIGHIQLEPTYFANYLFIYQLDRVIHTGFGTGVRKYTGIPTYQSYHDLLVPTFVQIRVNPLERKISPIALASFGGSFAPQNKMNWVGTFWNVLIGGKVQFSKKFAVSLAAGYENQGMKVTEEDPYIDWTGTANIRKHAILYQVGFHF